MKYHQNVARPPGRPRLQRKAQQPHPFYMRASAPQFGPNPYGLSASIAPEMMSDVRLFIFIYEVYFLTDFRPRNCSFEIWSWNLNYNSKNRSSSSRWWWPTRPRRMSSILPPLRLVNTNNKLPPPASLFLANHLDKDLELTNQLNLSSSLPFLAPRARLLRRDRPLTAPMDLTRLLNYRSYRMSWRNPWPIWHSPTTSRKKTSPC